MPELPEVETIRALLAPSLTGKKIARVELKLGRLLEGDNVKNFETQIEQQQIVSVNRRAKYLLIILEKDVLMIHLGMTGQLTFAPKLHKEKPQFARTITGLEKSMGIHPVDRHTHFIIHFSNGDRLLYRDPRTFGKIIWIKGEKWETHARLKDLGPEPLESDMKKFVALRFPSSSSRCLKTWLLDQHVIAGVGNIYADEALWRAGLHPETPVSRLEAKQAINLMQAVKFVLQKGIKNQGTSFSDYRKPDGSAGNNYERLMVYGRGGQACKKCKSTLIKSVVAQRGTVYCPRCQMVPYFK